MWVPLVENGEHLGDGADYFIRKNLDHLLGAAPGIDTLLLACTHYPLLAEKIEQALPEGVKVVSQAALVGRSLQDYLQRHPGLETTISRAERRLFYTTDSTVEFDDKASMFFGEAVTSVHTDL